MSRPFKTLGWWKMCFRGGVGVVGAQLVRIMSAISLVFLMDVIRGLYLLAIEY